MKYALLFSTKHDHSKKKVSIFGIWFIALISPFFMLKFMFLGKILVPHALYPHEEDIYLLALLIISIGLIFRSNLIRRIALLILYLSMFFLLAEHIEESMRIFEESGCMPIFKGYGIDYDSLIYPKKILKFMAIFFLIPLIHILLIYFLSNEESCKLYKTHKSIYKKEALTLFLIGTTITIFFSISLTSHLREAEKTYPQQKSIILPTAKPFKIHTYESLNLPNKPIIMYKVKFEGNTTQGYTN